VDLGCGFDLQINKRISLRVFQFDLSGIRTGNRWRGFGIASFGAVFHLNKVSNEYK
jgi:hypothetical protein